MKQKNPDKGSRPDSGLPAAETDRFARIFKMYYSRLCHFSFQITGDKALSEDICQEAFIRYWDRRGDVSHLENAVKNYLYAVVRNASVSAVRHEKVVKRYLEDTGIPDVEEITTIHALIRSEVAAEIHSALETLPRGCGEVVRMAYLEGMKNKEIAIKLGVSVNTVKTQRQRALHLLRAKVSLEALSFLLICLL